MTFGTGTYKLHKATSVTMLILSQWKRKTLEGATSELCSRMVRHRTLRETLSRTCGVRMSPALSQTCVPWQPGFKSGGLRHLGPCRSESTTAGSLTPLISWSRRLCWSDAHCHGASLITASDNGNVVCSVSWIRIADMLNTRFFNCLYCKIIVVTDVFTTFLQIISLIRRVDTRGAGQRLMSSLK